MSRENRGESAYYHLVCYPEPACCSGSRTRRQLGRRGRAGWAAEEGTGCWSDREESRQCCGLLVSSKRSAAVLETGKCCRKTDGCRKLSSDDMLDILGDEIAEPPTPVAYSDYLEMSPEANKSRDIWTSCIWPRVFLQIFWLHTLIPLAVERVKMKMLNYSQMLSVQNYALFTPIHQISVHTYLAEASFLDLNTIS